MLPAQTAYYRHAVFDNSLQRDSYFNSSAVATAPSTLEAQNWRLPVETKNFRRYGRRSCVRTRSTFGKT